MGTKNGFRNEFYLIDRDYHLIHGNDELYLLSARETQPGGQTPW